jgi:hypothetical protein
LGAPTIRIECGTEDAKESYAAARHRERLMKIGMIARMIAIFSLL